MLTIRGIGVTHASDASFGSNPTLWPRLGRAGNLDRPRTVDKHRRYKYYAIGHVSGQ
ncbi:hypothetical protein QF001_000120 [Paraburkholderia youngii]